MLSVMGSGIRSRLSRTRRREIRRPVELRWGGRLWRPGQARYPKVDAESEHCVDLGAVKGQGCSGEAELVLVQGC